MKKYTIKYQGWDSLEEDLGEDFIFFNCKISPQKQQPFVINLSYRDFRKHLKEMEPGIYQLLQKAENETEKWGPHESEIIRVLIAYGIDLEPIVIGMFEQKYNLQEEIVRQAQFKPNPVKLDKFLTEMQQAATEIKTGSSDYFLICNTIEKAITSAIIEQYPVIMNSSTNCIKELRNILVKHIPKLAKDLNRLVQEAEES